jgi:hypothetical protein
VAVALWERSFTNTWAVKYGRVNPVSTQCSNSDRMTGQVQHVTCCDVLWETFTRPDRKVHSYTFHVPCAAALTHSRSSGILAINCSTRQAARTSFSKQEQRQHQPWTQQQQWQQEESRSRCSHGEQHRAVRATARTAKCAESAADAVSLYSHSPHVARALQCFEDELPERQDCIFLTLTSTL